MTKRNKVIGASCAGIVSGLSVLGAPWPWNLIPVAFLVIFGGIGAWISLTGSDETKPKTSAFWGKFTDSEVSAEINTTAQAVHVGDNERTKWTGTINHQPKDE